MGKRKIIFRADGGLTIGMGHFIRTLALAEMLRDDFYCIYVTKSPTTYQINEIKKVCHERIDLPDNETHFNIFLSLLKGDEIVVLDNYYFTTVFQQLIKDKGCKLVCIDDKHDRHFVAEVVINHAEGIISKVYSAENYTNFLLGYKYALLRKEYLTDNDYIICKLYSCLIIMGGVDPMNITIKIMSLLQKHDFTLPVAVVVGAGYSNDEQLKQFNNFFLFKGISALQIFQLMSKSTFGILPASTVSIEACAVRLPSICGFFIDNQKEIYSGIKERELAVCVDNFLEIDNDKLVAAIEKINNPIISERIINRQIELLDKRSKIRFIKVFQEL